MSLFFTTAELTINVGGSDVMTQFSDLDDDGVSDADVITLAGEKADAMIQGKLGQRFSPAALTSSNIVKSWALNLASYEFALFRGMSDLERFKLMNDKATRELDMCARGDMQLDVEPKPTGSELVTSGALGPMDAADADDGGPFWDEPWRDEAGEPVGFWENLDE